jgi:hypothetical protein
MTTTRRRGTAVERYAWVLLAVLCAAILVFGLEAWLAQGSPDDVINGSGCCNGHRMSEAPRWVHDYGIEQARYMATFMVGTGVFGLGAVLAGLRRARRWAWALCWYVPVLFGVHGLVLGSFPFDIPTFTLGILGLLLMIRPVFAGPPDDPQRVSAGAAVAAGAGR